MCIKISAKNKSLFHKFTPRHLLQFFYNCSDIRFFIGNFSNTRFFIGQYWYRLTSVPAFRIIGLFICSLRCSALSKETSSSNGSLNLFCLASNILNHIISQICEERYTTCLHICHLVVFAFNGIVLQAAANNYRARGNILMTAWYANQIKWVKVMLTSGPKVGMLGGDSGSQEKSSIRVV